MPYADTEWNRAIQTANESEHEYYQFCREQMRPYFGRIMWASQGLPLRHVVMQELVRLETARQGADPFHILEVGSWAGGSAITWAEALTRSHRANGHVVCVDPWKPYFDMAKRPDADVYREMSEALAKDTIYDLFLHNIAASGYTRIVLPLRGPSAVMLPALPRNYFDLVFVDGDHSYAAVLADITVAAGLIKDGGILCGDDLELQRSEIDQEYAKTQIESDYIRDPRSGQEYHPGVTLAVGELFGEVSNVVGCWAVRKRGPGWERLDMSKVVCSGDRIPPHLTRRDPATDPDFQRWRERRRQPTSRVATKEPKLIRSTAIARMAPTPRANQRVLLIQLDFQSWATARPWSYSAAFGVQEGLSANGVECVTVPAIAEHPCSSPDSWVYHAKKALAGQCFDQVWVWLVHTPLDTATLEWVASLAPIRVGVLMESLRYDDQDYAWAPQLKSRLGRLDAQLPYLTHVLAPDERDAADLSARSSVKVLWWPPMVPERYIIAPPGEPSQRQAVFHGTPYGRRQSWVNHAALQQRVTFAKPAHPPTRNQILFDHVQQTAVQYLREGRPVAAVDIADYVRTLKNVRLGEFNEWMAQLPQWLAIVNFPSLAKFYGGRVFESMAAGRPVISWCIPDRPNNLGLFQEGREILLFDPDDPGKLVREIDRILQDRSFADSVARNAQDTLRRFHTSERRLQQTLQWLECGTVPDYGLTGSRFLPEIAQLVPNEVATVPTGMPLPCASEECGVNKLPIDSAASIARPTARRLSQIVNDSNKVSDSFYVDLFVNKPGWSTPEPNADEAARWSKIASFLETIIRESRTQGSARTLRILDVGCGRGWLTNLATAYGICEGVEPVAGVVDYARRLFPHIPFEVGTPESVLARADFEPFDIVLCSEVIEHVPHPQKAEFVNQLSRLLTANGYLVLTTPRAEMWEQWSRIAPPNQPVEDWVTEQQLRELFDASGFHELGVERIQIEVPSLRYIPAATPVDLRTMSLMPIYQVWACRRVDPAHHAIPKSFTRKPMVSVVVPTYNRPDRLRDALKSILTQTYQDFEIIIINDGGTDAESVVSVVNDGRITYIKHDRNKGLAASRNTGLRAAKGKYIAYLDDDDRYLPDHLETLVNFLEHNEYKVAYTDAWRVHEQVENGHNIEIGRDLLYSHEFNLANLLVSNYFPVLCVMHERCCIDEVGPFDEALFAHEDWDLWIRMATRYPFRHLKRTTGEFTWRTDGSSMTSATRETYWRTMEIIYRKYRPYAERVVGVLEAQQQALEKMRVSIQPRVFDCSIIIPVWNKRELTEQCLTELAKVTSGVTYEVVVVDNHSTDDTASFLSQLSGDIRIIRNNENLGFSKACNQGAQAARGRFLVFLNNDTIPLENWLTAMVAEVVSHPEVGIVGSKLLYENDTVQHAGVVFSRCGLMPYHLYRRFHRDHPAVNQRRTFQSVTAACMLIRRESFEAVGGFDEGFQNGFEDVDLCLKVCDKGWKIVYQPLSMLYHLESQTPGRKTHEQANALRFLMRWGQRWWLADEDLYYFADGYVPIYTKDEDKEMLDLRPFRLDGEKASWKLVADTERAALRQDTSLVESLLARWGEWPSVSDVLIWAAWLCTKTGHSSLSRHYCQKLMQDHDDPTARRTLTRMALEEGNLAEADSLLGVLLKRYPEDGEGWVLRGIFNMQKAEYAEAEQAFLSALTHQGDRRKSMMGLGMARVGLNASDQAWDNFCSVLNEYPDDAEAIHWLLRAGTVRGSWVELSKRLQDFILRNPAALSVRYALAGVLLRSGQTGAAQQEYRTLCSLDPSYEGLEELARALSMQDTLAEVVPQS
jgi:GT2 family glycosyltransferase/predicted O-methyltransferase YrrM/Tfp pilus assembly protein PilF